MKIGVLTPKYSTLKETDVCEFKIIKDICFIETSQFFLERSTVYFNNNC